ncbi:CheR family methyltransferase, partial [Janthinobacterium fluminis]
MTALPGVREVKRFRELIAARLGLDFDEARLGNLAKLLTARGGADCGAYLDSLDGAADAAELARLAPELTVTETYFFRSIDQIRAYAEVALPQRLQAGDGLRPVRVLSAGCASGEEPYSLAIAALALAGLTPNRLALTGLDINPLMLAKAAQARYTSWSLREFPAELKGRWFRPDGDAFLLDDAIRRMVRFEQRNLAQEGADFWLPGSFDIVFCRNVLMYFTPAQAQAAVARIARALAPGGYFFFGHAETLRGLSNDFHLCHSHGAFYYQRKGEALAAAPAPPAAAAPPRWPAAP